MDPRHRVVLLVVAAAAAATLSLRARQSPVALESCVVVLDVATDRVSRSRDTTCTTRLPPASTFKIPHALVALETGVVTATSVERWDGTAYPGRPAWPRDHTVVSAMRPSVVWFFQRIAPRVGAERMHSWLARLGYGNADTSGPVTEYWLNGRLRVSPEEQVHFLRRFYDGTLPVAAAHVASVQSSLVQEAGRFENASGSHPLEVAWRDGLALSAKTGATTASDGTSVSWLVGRLTVDGRHQVFASAVWAVGRPVDPLAGAHEAMRELRRRGLVTGPRSAGPR